MNFTIIEAEQRSVEWFAARSGRVTGSRADAIFAKGRGVAESTQRRDYRIQLACERLTGVPQESGYINAEMQRGIDCEPLALAAYESLTGNLVNQTGFLRADALMVGCSLDGHIGDFRGILELKCPKTATHVGYLRDPSSLVRDYQPQVTHNLWVSGAEWCDLMSFDDRLPKPLQVVKVAVLRGNVDLAAHAAAVERFLAEVSIEVQDLNKLMEKAA